MCPDLRNSRSFDLVRRLQWLGHEVEVADPIASAEEIEREHGLERDGARRPALRSGRRRGRASRISRACPTSGWRGLVAPGGTLADLKGMWRERAPRSRARPVDIVRA